MIEADLRAVWRVRSRGEEREIDQALITLLEVIGQSGKLGQSAKAAGISYRHAWNLIERWGEFLGAPLVDMRRGKGSRLMPAGERILWAGRRVQSRLAPELDGLAGDFARAVNESLDGAPVRLVVHASHDFAVALLRERLAAAGVPMVLQCRGSFDALGSLLRGDCAVAGFHVADGPMGAMTWRRLAEGFSGRDVRLLAIARRRQGLIVAHGNPRNLRSVADLADAGVRIVNRQRGSGTRALFEYLLNASRVDRARLRGYEDEEITHSAVAALVAGRQADAGFGLEAAAARFHLGFVPVATERYFLAVGAENCEHHDVRALLRMARGAAFAAAVNAIPGYRASRGEPLRTVDEAGAAAPIAG